ncbi:hypothetical protein AZ09_13150 [Acetobacter aceti 1023]|nr:hypothetical protein AZ09_13150 [Acetobacter aceti 1023]
MTICDMFMTYVPDGCYQAYDPRLYAAPVQLCAVMQPADVMAEHDNRYCNLGKMLLKRVDANRRVRSGDR